MMGRWSSDVYEIYCRLSRQSAAGMAAVIGSTAFEDVEREAFVDDDLYVTTASASFHGGESWAEHDMLDDLADGAEDAM